MTVLDDLHARLAAYLTANGITAEINLGRWIQGSADEAILLRSYGGEGDRLIGDNGLPADERLAVQVITRASNRDVPKAAALAEAARSALSFRHETLASGRRYAYSIANQTPFEAGVDENDRPLVSMNLRLRRHRSDV